MTYGPKKKYCKSSLKHNQIFLYFMDILMLKLVICLPANLTRTRTRDLYPRHLDILLLERTFQSRMLTSLRKSSSVSSFCMYSLLKVYGIVHSFFYFSPKCLFSVRLCFALLTAGKGNRTSMYAEIFVS